MTDTNDKKLSGKKEFRGASRNWDFEGFLPFSFAARIQEQQASEDQKPAPSEP